MLLSACLPTVRPTSDWRKGPAFSHDTEYWRTNTNLLFRLRFLYYTMVSPFIVPCLLFSLSGEQKSEKIFKRCRWIVSLVLITLMVKCTDCIIHWNSSPSALLSCTDSSQPGCIHVKTYMYVLGQWHVNTAGVIKQIQWSFPPIHVTNYEISNILFLNKQTCMIFLPATYTAASVLTSA